MDISGNNFGGKKDKSGVEALAAMLRVNSTITNLSIAQNKLNANDTKILAPAIQDNGALASVNVMGNKLGKEELAKLQVIMKAHSTLQSLCGIAADATEANLSGLGMDAADAAVLADDIQDKGALS